LEHFAAIDQRREIEHWMKEATASGEKAYMAFACAESAANGLTVDSGSGVCEELPGYRVLGVPCAGWVHPLMIERALRHGAEGVMIVGCGPGECQYREGAAWEKLRIEGLREPVLRKDKVAEEQVLLLGLDRTQTKELVRQAKDFGGGNPPPGDSPRLPALTALAAVLLAGVFAGIVGVASNLGYASPQSPRSVLAVSFKHPGQMSENCEEMSEEELADVPVHMRKARKCERARSPVRLRVHVDGQPVVESSFAPSGLWSDGPSVAIERVPVELGEHTVRVEIGDGPDPGEWSFADERTLEFTREHRRVVLFERVDGFVWR
jgi:F420-non-reducing hydrogenase iron-sulfur subunit